MDRQSNVGWSTEVDETFLDSADADEHRRRVSKRLIALRRRKPKNDLAGRSNRQVITSDVAKVTAFTLAFDCPFTR